MCAQITRTHKNFREKSSSRALSSRSLWLVRDDLSFSLSLSISLPPILQLRVQHVQDSWSSSPWISSHDIISVSVGILVVIHYRSGERLFWLNWARTPYRGHPRGGAWGTGRVRCKSNQKNVSLSLLKKRRRRAHACIFAISISLAFFSVLLAMLFLTLTLFRSLSPSVCLSLSLSLQTLILSSTRSTRWLHRKRRAAFEFGSLRESHKRCEPRAVESTGSFSSFQLLLVSSPLLCASFQVEFVCVQQVL